MPGTALCRRLWESRDDGRIKLYVLSRALRLRRMSPALFLEGAYVPLEARGPKADHVVAFARRLGGAVVIAVAPRLAAKLREADGGLSAALADTELVVPQTLGTAFRDVFTGR